MLEKPKYKLEPKDAGLKALAYTYSTNSHELIKAKAECHTILSDLRTAEINTLNAKDRILHEAVERAEVLDWALH